MAALVWQRPLDNRKLWSVVRVKHLYRGSGLSSVLSSNQKIRSSFRRKPLHRRESCGDKDVHTCVLGNYSVLCYFIAKDNIYLYFLLLSVLMISYILDLWKIHFGEVFSERLLYCKRGLKPLCVELMVEELDNPGQNRCSSYITLLLYISPWFGVRSFFYTSNRSAESETSKLLK